MVEIRKTFLLLGIIKCVFIISIQWAVCETIEQSQFSIWEVSSPKHKESYQSALTPIGLYEDGRFRSFVDSELIEGEGYIEMNNKAKLYLKKRRFLSLLVSGKNVGKAEIVEHSIELSPDYSAPQVIINYENEKSDEVYSPVLALSDTSIKGNSYKLKTKEVNLFEEKIMHESEKIFRENDIKEDLINIRKITHFETIRRKGLKVVISIISITNDSTMCQDCSKLFLILEQKQGKDNKVVYKSVKKGVVRASPISIIGHFDVDKDGFDEIVLSHGLEWGMYYEILSRDGGIWKSVYKSPEFDIQ